LYSIRIAFADHPRGKPRRWKRKGGCDGMPGSCFIFDIIISMEAVAVENHGRIIKNHDEHVTKQDSVESAFRWDINPPSWVC
jgi:hypothetical protein